MNRWLRRIFTLSVMSVVIICNNACQPEVTEGTFIAADNRDEEYRGSDFILEELESSTAEAEVLSSVLTSERKLSLVFEGYTDESEMKALTDLLKEREVSSVIFLAGIDASDHTAVAKYISKAGIEIGNYSLSKEKHAELESAETNTHRFYRTQEIIMDVTGQIPSLLRCNNSEYTSDILRIAYLCQLNGAVKPSAYLNYRSFSDYNDALNYVRKIPRGSVITIKLGQELDEEEFGHTISKDVQVSKKLSSEYANHLFDGNETTEPFSTVEIAGWLLSALEAEEFTIVPPDELKKAELIQLGEPKKVSSAVLSVLDPSHYPSMQTETPLGVQQNHTGDANYFDDVIFIGDSAIQSLAEYNGTFKDPAKRPLGNAEFAYSEGLSINNALWTISDASKHPFFRGKLRTLEDAVAFSKKKNVHLMLGANDLATRENEEIIADYKLLLYLIKKNSPEVRIVIHSILPKSDKQLSPPTNEQIFGLNMALYQFALEYGFDFVDSAYAMRDTQGALPSAFCADAKKTSCRLSGNALDVWIDFLLKHIPSVS